MYEFILVLEAYECSYVTLYMPYDMLCPYVMSYLYCVIICDPVNVQSVTTGKVRVIHWARGAHDLTIFQVLETRRDHRSIKRTYLDLEGSLYVYVMDYVY